jgi:hypothetical protein
MEEAMRRISTMLLAVLMGTFLSLGFYGLFQHAANTLSASIERGR